MLTLSGFYVRTMTEQDIDQIVEIEHESFPTAWPRTAYRKELSNKFARYLVVVDREHAPISKTHQRAGILGFLSRKEDAVPPREYVVGYVGIWFMVDEAHIVAIAVREAYRRRGIGETLLAEAIELSLNDLMESVTLEVRRTNFAAQALYEKYRFLRVGVRKRYYSDNNEDAIIMSTPPIQHVSYREHLDYLRQAREQRWSESGS